MIRDLSLTLRTILSQSGLPPELASALKLFDRPTAQFNPTQTSINLFLYDLRENLDLRSNEAIVTRQDGKAIIQPPPIRLACSYLVTAWPKGSSGDEFFLLEHELLGQAFNVLSSYDTIPPELLPDSLKGENPVPIVTSHIDNLKTTGEFWTALGNQLRPSISVTITISLPPFIPSILVLEDLFIVTAVDLRLESQESPVKPPTNLIEAANFLRDDPSAGAESFRIGGQITGADDRAIPNATISILEHALTTTTNENGVYSIGPIDYRSGSPPQTLTLRVRKDANTRDYPIVIPPLNITSYNLKFP